MTTRGPVALTPVERRALEQSPFDVLYEPEEKIPTLVVEHFPALGRLAALRFLEWVQANPEGVASLSTGKTPEHFIAWVRRLLTGWDAKETRGFLEQAGMDPARRPDLRGLRFVQIDEFYPIDPAQHNSFTYYVNRYYIDGFGLDRGRALLMDGRRIGLLPGQTLESVWPGGRVDLSLRVRRPQTELERTQRDALARVDEWCRRYEDRIRGLGGLGFFLGGIGPDGHIGFNVRGSDHHSTTQLTETNYETQAAAAGDLGGIDVARSRLVLTIGLGTLRFNPSVAAVILAAGEAKAGVVADAVRGECSIKIPASALHGLPGARFYVTRGAARLLPERQRHALMVQDRLTEAQAEAVVVQAALRLRKRVADLEAGDLRGDPLGEALLAKGVELPPLLGRVRDALAGRIEAGARVAQNVRFLHTEPHHDDIMLGILPAVVRHVRPPGNAHAFATLTSGFTAVTNGHMRRALERLRDFLDTPGFRSLAEEGYFAPANAMGRNRDMWQYLDGIAAADPGMRDEGAARRLLRNLAEVFEDASLPGLAHRIEELLHYFRSAYPGQKDLAHIQRLKGMCREWEAECLWGYLGWNCESVRHLRLGFYTGDLFTEEPTVERDVPPVLRLLEETRPDVVTLALDPEASGPDTHYKVLQALAEALRRHAEASGRGDLRVWGYRNVWFRFQPWEANVFVPVSLNMFAILENAFMNSFVSQKDAPFPSHEHDGPFCGLAQRIQSEQYQMLKTCLGREWFHEHPSALIRATRGLVFLKEMGLAELQEHGRALRQATEDR